MEKLIRSLSLHLNVSRENLLRMSASDLIKILKEKHGNAVGLKILRNYEEAEYSEMIADEVELFILEKFKLT